MLRRKTRLAIKRFFYLAASLYLLNVLSVMDVVLSGVNNLHMSQNFALDTLGNLEDTDARHRIRRKRRTVLDIQTLCPETPKRLVGRVPISREVQEIKITEKMNDDVKDGSYEPSTCRSRHRVAIIIPLRGRKRNLLQLLAHMHPIWQRQELNYTVFTITQSGTFSFNKAKLMNSGFKEARAYGQYDCFVFHDVDALLEDDRCLYWCDHENPRHLCEHADVFKYRDVWYFPMCRPTNALFTMTKLFGGVTMFTAEQFIKINGFSNYYWGWGGEDDDMYNRLINKGYKLANKYGRHCSYTLLQHPHETENAPTRAKESLIFHSTSRQDKEGLNTVKYKVLSYEYNPLFVNITIDVGKPTTRMQTFINNSKKLWYFNQCIVRMPWNL